jgi:hypothetical protein
VHRTPAARKRAAKQQKNLKAQEGQKNEAEYKSSEEEESATTDPLEEAQAAQPQAAAAGEYEDSVCGEDILYKEDSNPVTQAQLLLTAAGEYEDSVCGDFPSIEDFCKESDDGSTTASGATTPPSSADDQEAWMTSPPSPDMLEKVSKVQKPRWADMNLEDEDALCEDQN